MLLITVIFDPRIVSQDLVDSLKQKLPYMVTQILSSDEVRIDPTSIESVMMMPKDIKVTQRKTHPTDVNMPSFMIYIEAGRQKGRSGEKIVELLGKYIAEVHLVSPLLLYNNPCCTFITFHEQSSFGFISHHPYL